jgi:spore coat protein U-like protein
MPAVRRFLAASGAAWLVLAAPGAAIAANSCTVRALPVSFGAYDRLTTTDLTALGSITVTCTAAGQITIYLSSGGSGGFFPRRMTAAGNTTLNYNLFMDQPGSRIWGDGTGGSQTLTATSAAGAASFQVFGRIPAQQSQAKVGSYSDTIMVTVNF